ncbi:MAG: hypothetical protein KGS61_04745 [Verrucomicrobia bacterium]|nr:hypothetical protein [Verrucomicrobiota bacterium]
MKAIFPPLFLALWLSSGRSVPAAEPANPNASPKARAILNYFHALGARQERRLLSGQFTGTGDRANLELLSRIHDQTGCWPALMGVDYADFSHRRLTSSAPNRSAIAYWHQGGLVTISAHLYNPANATEYGLRDPGVDLNRLLVPGTETYRRWMGELDLAADGLRELRDAGVVVLWRPFHEMNGGWFWWGAKDPPTFIQVWRQMFDYFTRVKRLDNLLWVYSPNHGAKTAAYYPGDQYVDLVGLDAYTDFVDTHHIRGYAEVARLGKPFGFTEFGPHGAQNPPGDYDYRRFIEGVTRDFPQAVFFMCWDWKWSLAANTHTQEMLRHPWLVNRAELPPGLAGAGR